MTQTAAEPTAAVPQARERVFSGIHFRAADEVAIVLGTQVANWALDHHFAPAN